MQLKVILIILLGLIISNQSSASVTYSYTSKDMEVWYEGGIAQSIPYPITTNHIFISLTFSDTGDSLLGFTASQANIGTITNYDILGGNPAQIRFQTSPTGVVTNYAISIYSPPTTPITGAYRASFLSYSGMLIGGDPIPSGAANSWDTAVVFDNNSNTLDYWIGSLGSNFAISNPGTWTSTGTLASLDFHQTITGSLSPVPEPSELSLMLVGLSMLGLSRKHKVTTLKR